MSDNLQMEQAVPMRKVPPPSSHRRTRRFEMIPIPGRHKFEIRDLNDEFDENDVVVPLSLPKLPTDRKEIVTSGLIRSTNSCNEDSEMDMSMSIGSRPTSLISTGSEVESVEEEKLKIDLSSSEKNSKVKKFYCVRKIFDRNKFNFRLQEQCQKNHIQ